MSDSTGNAAAFLSQLSTDEAFRQRVTTRATSASELLAVAAAEGYVFTSAELSVALSEIESQSATLSDSELEGVAGGGRFYGTAAQLVKQLFGE